MKKQPHVAAVLAFNLLAGAVALGVPPATVQQVISAFRQYKDVTVAEQITVPAVVEVPFADEYLERFDVAVLDQTTNAFEPHYFRQEVRLNQIPLTATANVAGANTRAMLDADPRTYTEFTVPDEGEAVSQIGIESEQPITSSTLTILLDSNVALPNTIAIRAGDGAGNDKIIVAPRRMEDETISFPKTTARAWTVTLTHSQLLRITELRLLQENAAKQSTNAVRFLAQPGHQYRVYFDPDRYSAPPVGEAGNLVADEGVLVLPAQTAQKNPAYVIADVDADGVPDVSDNCVAQANPDQEDKNGNRRGDACDDFDRDGLINADDNCPNSPNRNQADTDGDRVGDSCDTEESRLTERYPWLPWLGIGSAALVLIILFALTGRSVLAHRDEPPAAPPDQPVSQS